MLEQIDFDIIEDIVKVCSQPGREMRPEMLSRKRYHVCGGSYSCGQINERGSYSWFCVAAGLVMDGVDLRADPPAAAWRALLSRRQAGVSSRWYDDWLETVKVGAAAPPLRLMGPRLRAGRAKLARAKAVVTRGVDRYAAPTQIIEMVADIRRVAAAIGASSPAMLQWSDYRLNGGRFTREQVNAVSNWSGLRAAADAASELDSRAA